MSVAAIVAMNTSAAVQSAPRKGTEQSLAARRMWHGGTMPREQIHFQAHFSPVPTLFF
jgi:hypothetical protein